MEHDVLRRHATWKVDGHSYDGTITILWMEISPRIPKTDEAFVIDDRGYGVTNVGTAGHFGRWGAVPSSFLAGTGRGVEPGTRGLVTPARRTTRGADPEQATIPPSRTE